MPDLDNDLDDDLDNDLDRAIGARFGALRGSIAAAVPLPGTEEIIGRGRRRRRNGQAALAGLAVLAVLAVGSVLFGPLHPDRTPPVDPSPSASPAYVPRAGATRAPVGGRVPTGFLPLESPAVPARLQPRCAGPATLSTNASIVASASADGMTLLVYPNGGTASRAYDEYRAEVRRCADSDPRTRVGIEPLTFGAQAFQAVTSAGSRPTGYQAVVRYGWSLLLVEGSTENAVSRAGNLERSLCVFAADCTPRDHRPAPLESLVAGGDAWAAVLATHESEDAWQLGHAVAVAGQMGYRTSVTSVDCDEGARQALGLPADSSHRYVAVYFESRQDADAFAQASSLAVVATIPVRTYCIA